MEHALDRQSVREVPYTNLAPEPVKTVAERISAGEEIDLEVPADDAGVRKIDLEGDVHAPVPTSAEDVAHIVERFRRLDLD